MLIVKNIYPIWWTMTSLPEFSWLVLILNKKESTTFREIAKSNYSRLLISQVGTYFSFHMSDSMFREINPNYLKYQLQWPIRAQIIIHGIERNYYSFNWASWKEKRKKNINKHIHSSENKQRIKRTRWLGHGYAETTLKTESLWLSPYNKALGANCFRAKR